ncbi:hypothetical protein SPRG_07201 [Saprolegnia parasitica CBS 223.65]|uniref:Uncharacterized protein n=1 Tax=Saprolegnia parasitica (strain CBS 223.65) TaxID=695850 RepID=A0A067CM75_SAPPC|nr:hypothetical protein SPRG_07201 [Saprolegnia parasitica CBS 223.65]KDO27927.1 hypothetical protein SPRG_07201 [Saprolegnia parasitica CBS 223.65]|eukprot:XP_012201383.1 hypothetical protein SPRG_07201 [Saprolegnia parasitica CBS 223.65]
MAQQSVAQRRSTAPLSMNDVDDEDDELPETLEKPTASPRTMLSSFTAKKPDDIAACDDEDDDDLPEMVDRATSPGEMATPPPPRASRTPSQQAAIDQRVLSYRRRILAIGLRAWRDALRRRKRKQEAAKRQDAVKQLQGCFRRYRCRRLLANAIEERRRQRLWKLSIFRLASLWRKPRLRAALHAWLLLQVSAQMEKKLLDEQARVKSLAHAISVQTQAEATCVRC